MRDNVCLSVRGLRKLYPPDILALESLDLDVRRGEFMSVIGPSGCGKTTFLRVVAGLEDYQRGTVTFEGEEIARTSWRRSVIYQDIRLFPWMTVRENVLFPLLNKGMSRAEAGVVAARWIDTMGLSAYLDRYPAALSAGARQQVGMCRVLASDPDLILCDEPFSALDWTAREFLQTTLLRYWYQTRKTVIFVTHNIEEAVYMGQRVVCMTARPGFVKEVVEVPLPEERWTVPRNAEVLLRVARGVARQIQEEVEKAREVEKEVGY